MTCCLQHGQAGCPPGCPRRALTALYVEVHGDGRGGDCMSEKKVSQSMQLVFVFSIFLGAVAPLSL